MRSFGEKVIELRKIKNMTQSELGSLLNVSAQAVSKWENNQSEPDMETLKRMCSIFNVSLNELLSYEETAVTNGSSSLSRENNSHTKVIVGYCSQCKKPISQEENYEVVNGRFRQLIYCEDCDKKLKQERAEKERKDISGDIKHGFIWGTLAGIVVFVLLLIAMLNSKVYIGEVITLIVLTYSVFALIAQLFWDGAIIDIFDFFTRSFSMPGVIFSLDIDGIIWFIVVKLSLSILAILLSILVFLFGIVVALVVAPFSFPFATARIFRERNEAGEEIYPSNNFDE